MATLVADRVIHRLDEVRTYYYRLIVVAGPSGTGKTAAVQQIAAEMGLPLVNVNLELSRRMLELTARQRCLKAPTLLAEIVKDLNAETVLLDNTEILFDVHLRQDPLRLLQRLSRNKTIVATWNGTLRDGDLTYAAPGHPEYRRYPVKDFVLVDAADGASAPQTNNCDTGHGQ